MLRLRILGRAELRSSGGVPLDGVTSQPKLLGLLSYLAAARRGGPARRDTLLALFWPELGAQAGRHALSQALSVLRAELGGDVLDGRYRETVSLDPAGLWCDVVAFREAAGAGRHHEALGLYGGALLDGVFVPLAPEFERWVEDERHELQRLAAGAAIALARDSRAAGSWAAASAAAQRALELDPYDETAWRELIASLDARGDRAGAVAEFQRMVVRMQQDLGVDPSPETLQLLESVRARGMPRTVSASDQAFAVSSAPSALSTPPRAVPKVLPRSAGWRWRRAGVGAGTLGVALTGMWAGGMLQPQPSTAIDPQRVAILPFRISGDDAALAALGEGMVDLLELRLDVQGTLQVASPRATIPARGGGAGAMAHPDSGAALARRLGAGLLLTGSVVALPAGRVQLSATLQRVPDGPAVGRATVAGSADSLMVLVDGLAAQLLGLGAGEEGERLWVLGNTPLPAVRSYLAGRAAERGGRFADAARSYDAALEQDSTFVFAAVRLLGTLSWVGEFFPAGSVQRALDAARAHRHRLGPRDRLRAGAHLGGTVAPISLRGQTAYLEHAVTVLPDDAEMWYQLGDLLLHQGAFAGIGGWRERAAAAFERALQLDSAYLPAVTHRFQLAFDEADPARALALVTRSRKLAPDGIAARALEWAEAVLRADSTTLANLRADRFANFDEPSLTRIMRKSGSYGLRSADGQLAGEVRLERAASAAERARAARALAYHLDKRGRREAAARARELWRRNAQDPRSVLRNSIYALMSDGSATVAAAAARELAGAADAPLARDPNARPAQLADLCAVALWRLSSGELARLPRMAAALRSVSEADPAWVVRDARICAITVETGLAAARGAITRELLLRLDSALTDLPFLADAGTPQELRWGNLLAAELWERHGDTAAAFAALQRRGHTTDAMMNPIAFLRMECRLAVAAQRPEIARAACERLLALRDDPDPELRPETEQLRLAYEAFRDRGR